ncbi:MAG: ATP-binding protein [Formosimonas sp.]
MNKYLKAILVGTMLLGAGLLVALTLATRSNKGFESQYGTLLMLNIAVIVVMIVLLVVLGGWLWHRFRKQVFGTRLLIRFALSFALLGIVPSVLLFAVSSTFVARTIDSWFNLKLDGALQAGIGFGREGLARVNEQAVDQLAALVERESGTLDGADAALVNDWLKRYRWKTVAALDGQGGLVWQFNAKNAVVDVPRLTPEMSQAAQTGWSVIEDESDTQDESDAAVAPKIHALKAVGGHGKVAYLYVQRAMPDDFTQKVGAIQAGLRDYQATESSRSSLKNLYRVTLGIVLLVTSLAAVAAAFLIANRMIQPILWLAQATRMVAQGRYELVPQRVKGSDELIQLVDSFGDMAQQLDVTQSSLNAAKAYSEAILQNLSAGVLVFDGDLRLESYNAYANRMFHTQLEPYLGRHMHDIEPLSSIYESIHSAMARPNSQPWRVQENITFNLAGRSDDLTVSIQGTRFVAQNGHDSYVLVCDDISAIVSAQRTLAWGEVARRLAHEIKNPLTPIQLSAERLQMKLSDKLDDNDQNLLERSTRTIVNQVQALQNMVNEFRDYARAPEVAFAPVDLNALIEEVLVLYESGQGTQYQIVQRLEANLPALVADAQQLRQVLHNLFKNALEAAPEGFLPEIEVSTVYVAAESAVRLRVKDNGAGFAPKVLARMFEPYNTSKATGTGLGLPVVKKIIDAHHAKISVQNHFESNDENNEHNEILGAQIDILFSHLVQHKATN